MKVGLIGCGYWGKKLIRNFYNSEHFDLAVVADLDPLRLEEVRGSYLNLKTTENTDELVTDDSIELVVVATPVKTHFELVKQALLHGKHVLVEKTLTNSYESAFDLSSLARQKNLHLIVDYTYLYSSEVKKIKGLIEANKHDSILKITSSRFGKGIVREDVSEIWDLSSHDFAIINYLIDERPVSVKATKDTLNGDPNKPKIGLSVIYENGIEANFECTWYSEKKIRKMKFDSTYRSIIFDDTLLQNKIAIEKSSKLAYPSYEKDEALANLVSELYQVLKNGKKSKSPASFDLEIIKILEAAQNSLNQNGKITQLKPLPIML
ncbi:MAG: Gfo/Idh/MocA family oxidoreductase [Vicingaceae bacterium]